MNATTVAIPGSPHTVRVPTDWRLVADPDAGLVAVEKGDRSFVANVVAQLDRPRREHAPDVFATGPSMLVAPVVIDVSSAGSVVDIVVCHLAGSISATLRQRQVIVDEGLLVVTFTAATSRWDELCDLAADVLDSIGAAA